MIKARRFKAKPSNPHNIPKSEPPPKLAKVEKPKTPQKPPSTPPAASKLATRPKPRPVEPKPVQAAPRPCIFIPEQTPWLDKKDPAARLCRMADKAGVSIAHFATSGCHDAAIKRAKLKIDNTVIARAKALDRQWESAFRNRVLALGGRVD